MVRWASGYGPGPTYLGGRAPEHLRTRRQLRAEGLSVAGLRPLGWLQYNPHHAVCPLYDRQAARPVRPLSDRQRAALAAGRALANTAPCFPLRAGTGALVAELDRPAVLRLVHKDRRG
ncbi:hypothetical protein [Krasilnikovia sp. MM14-A1259]|uniref:hypothetical protein n=1 Tax=Krasilnikovia sp. MM14-A1259 TaxID=3373539 RepID=UPI0038021568